MTGISRWLVVLLVGPYLLAGGCGGGGGTQSSTAGARAAAAPPSNPTNSPPSISGTPPGSVIVNQLFSFTPNASDPDGDALTFSIQNSPAWASFDARNGELEGAPTPGDVGVYSGISVSVTDGQASAAMPQFTISVDQFGNVSATLSWTPPTQNEDGTPLSDLAGYNLYYGTTSGSYPNQIRVDNPGITSFVVTNLSPNTYYFVATAFNSTGLESSFSQEAVKTLN